MSLRINHNTAALNGHRSMVRNDAAVSKSLERLSSGLRINRAADDAAGLIISEQMRAQIGGMSQAIRNSETAVSMVQTAEGALDEINTLLLKARDLALHAANEGANDQNQLVADQTELDNIVDAVNRIAENTQFGGKKILDGSLGSVQSANPQVSSVRFGGQYLADISAGTVKKGYHSLQVTAQAAKAVSSLSISGSDIIASGAAATNYNLSGMALTEVFQRGFAVEVMGAQVSVTSGTTKGQFVQSLNAIGQAAGFTAVVSTGSVSNGTSSGTVAVGDGQIALISSTFGAGKTFGIQFVAGASGAQSIAGTLTSGVHAAATIYFNTGTEGGTATTGAAASLALTGNGLSLANSASSGAGFMVQLQSNIMSGTVLLGALDGTSGGATFQIGANVAQTATVQLDSMRAGELGQGVSSVYGSVSALKGGSLINGGADEALKILDVAINDVSVTRGRLGAFQSATLETTISNLRATHENLTTAESTIRDADFAFESANFTKNNILMQASTSMLAQANQLPQNVLQLLQG